MRQWETDAASLKAYEVADFLKLELPPRRLLLPPWLDSGSLGMVYAPRGVGKTHFAMHLAYAVATGGRFLRWQAPAPTPVLYIDGEMGAAAMQQRWRAIVEQGGEPAPGMLRMLSRDAQLFGELPNLASTSGLEAISHVFGDAKLVILDNLSSLTHGVKENEAESWEPISQWAIRQRALDLSLLFVHHAGKNGSQRGTSKREDMMDVVIGLRRPMDYSPEQGARFEVNFEKARSLFGPDVAPFEAQLVDGQWNMAEAAGLDARMLALRAEGHSLSEIAAEMDCDKSTVSRRLAKVRGGG